MYVFMILIRNTINSFLLFLYLNDYITSNIHQSTSTSLMDASAMLNFIFIFILFEPFDLLNRELQIIVVD